MTAPPSWLRDSSSPPQLLRVSAMQRVALPLACGAWRAACCTARRPRAPPPWHAAAAGRMALLGRVRSRTLQLNALGSSFVAQPPGPAISGPPAEFVVVDGNPLLYAAHFAFEGPGRERLRTTGGVDTSIPFLFLRAMLTLLETQPTHFCIAFDPPSEDSAAPPPEGWTAPWRPDTARLLPPTAVSAAAMQARSWRHEIFPDYKGKRSPPPEPLVDAQPLVHELLDALGLPWVQITSIEADDVIATLATVGAAAGLRTAIVSPDKDFQQLLSPMVHLLRPTRRKRGVQPSAPLPDFEPFTADDFRLSSGGLEPPQFVDFLALVGDAVDNIPGVAGIGDQTAPTLLLQHGSMEGVLAAAAAGGIMPTRAAKAFAKPGAAESARMSAVIAKLVCNIDVPLLAKPVDEWRLRQPADGGEAALELMHRLEFGPITRNRVMALWSPF